MIYTITKRFTFDAAHFLPKVPEGHRCRQMHGHTYEVEVSTTSDRLTDEGWVVDFGDLAAACRLVKEKLDHRVLNDIITNPTAELVAAFILRQVPEAACVVVRETPDSWCEVTQ